MSTNGNNLARRALSAALLVGALAVGGAALGVVATAGAEPALLMEDAHTPPTEGTQAGDSARKLKIKGVVTRRDADTFTVRDVNGADTR